MSLLNKLLRIKYIDIMSISGDYWERDLIRNVIVDYMRDNNLTEYNCVDHGVEMKFIITEKYLTGFTRNEKNVLICYKNIVLMTTNSIFNTHCDDIEKIFDENCNTVGLTIHSLGKWLYLSSVLKCIERDQPLLSELYKVRHLKADTHEVNDIIANYIVEVVDHMKEYRFTHGSTSMRFLYDNRSMRLRDYNIVGYICNHNYIVIYSYTFPNETQHGFKGERAFICGDDIMRSADDCLDRKYKFLYPTCMGYVDNRCSDSNSPTIDEFISSQITKSARNFTE